ncbi:MAG: hypothetical protein J0M37_01145 [Ignavibacteria bacterium]|nr:hypothetical protein [Ignavibacteria bacterium]
MFFLYFNKETDVKPIKIKNGEIISKYLEIISASVMIYKKTSENIQIINGAKFNNFFLANTTKIVTVAKSISIIEAPARVFEISIICVKKIAGLRVNVDFPRAVFGVKVSKLICA